MTQELHITEEDMEMIMNETEMNQLGLFLETFPLEIKSLMFASTENIRLLSA